MIIVTFSFFFHSSFYELYVNLSWNNTLFYCVLLCRDACGSTTRAHSMIRKLSEDVQTHLRTGVSVSSVTQYVEELVLNALDAEASSVAVRVDLHTISIQVVDNGHGIARDPLVHIGQRYVIVMLIINCMLHLKDLLV